MTFNEAFLEKMNSDILIWCSSMCYIHRIWVMVNVWEFTFCSSARSRESTFICSFLRLAFSATLSALALARTWAISSFALQKRTQVRYHSVVLNTVNKRSNMHMGNWCIILILNMVLTCQVSPLRGFWGSDNVVPPASRVWGSPERTSLALPHSDKETSRIICIFRWII